MIELVPAPARRSHGETSRWNSRCGRIRIVEYRGVWVFRLRRPNGLWWTVPASSFSDAVAKAAAQCGNGPRDVSFHRPARVDIRAGGVLAGPRK